SPEQRDVPVLRERVHVLHPGLRDRDERIRGHGRVEVVARERPMDVLHGLVKGESDVVRLAAELPDLVHEARAVGSLAVRVRLSGSVLTSWYKAPSPPIRNRESGGVSVNARSATANDESTRFPAMCSTSYWSAAVGASRHRCTTIQQPPRPSGSASGTSPIRAVACSSIASTTRPSMVAVARRIRSSRETRRSSPPSAKGNPG